MQILDGKKLSKKIKDEIKEKVLQLDTKPGLAVVLVGENPASKVYVGMKKKACAYCGINSFSYDLPENVSEKELLDLIDKLNADDKIDGILVQLPLPEHIDEMKILDRILPEKDVDGFHAVNTGKLVQKRECLKPCTPYGIMKIFEEYNIDLEGKNAVVIGRSNIVGKPVALMLLHENATVTICHSRTKNLSEITNKADIIVVAIGRPKFLTVDMVKEGAVVIDVGINRVDGKLVGDVDFEKVSEKTSYITPVPGGVGPMTIAMLMNNTYEAYMKRRNLWEKK